MAIIGSNVIAFLLIFFGTFIVAKIFDYILNNYLSKIFKKTKSNVDDKIFDLAVKPLHYFLVVGGIYFAFKYLKLTNGLGVWVDGAFFVAIVFLIALVLSRVMVVLTNKWLKVKRKYERAPKLINKIISFSIYLVATLIALGHFDVEVTPVIATLGLGGLAIGLALQKTLSDFFSGIHIVSDRPIDVGDFIEIENGTLSGFVEDIGWRSTRIRTLPNNLVIVPNSKLAEGIIVNASMPSKEMGVIVKCGVSYEEDLDRVEKVTFDVATKAQKKLKGAVRGFKPLIRFNKFGESNINFSIILRVEDPVAKYLVVHEFIKMLKKEFDKKNIEISWPVRKIYNGTKKTKSRKR